MRRIVAFFFLLVSFGALSAKPPKDYVKYVDPFIGSVNCRWFFFTPAAVPFGMAKVAPQTHGYGGNNMGWEPTGYDSRHKSIEGFGHFHEFQVGGLLVMPTVGELKVKPGTQEDPDKGYRSRIDKNTEVAQPGYYAADLTDYGIHAELTATKRVGFHRYTFSKAEEAHVLFDLGHTQGEGGTIVGCEAKKVSDTEIEGYVETVPRYVEWGQPGATVRLNFVARFNKSIKSNGGFFFEDKPWTFEWTFPDTDSISGRLTGFYTNFDVQAGEQVEMKVGLSYTTIEQARLNLDAEAKDLSFDQAHAHAKMAWQKHLGRIEVEGGTHASKVKFYTALYHSLSGRGISSDVNGVYPRNDGGLGQIPLDANGQPLYQHHNSDACWGAFWNWFQLWTVAYPEYMSSYAQCHLDLFKDSGWMPDGVAAGKYSPGMSSNFLGVLLSATWNNGIRDMDGELAFKAALKNELEWRNRPRGVGRYGLDAFVERGYIPHPMNGWNFTATNTLENAYCAWSVGELAKALGHEKEAEKLYWLGQGYRNLFDPETKFMRPREADGKFQENFDEFRVWDGFQEGNAWQYTWFVPQDMEGLRGMMGAELFETRLDTIFTRASKNDFGGGKELDSFSGLEAIYNHGNQPGAHISFLFNYAGAPWKTQYWVREIMNTFYGTEAIHGYGYGQDEDQGQLGSWFVMAAMGLFDIQGGANQNPTFQISGPLFEKVTIHLNQKYFNGQKFVIEAPKNSDEYRYIQSATLNGKRLDNCWFYRKDLYKGGTLRLKMGKKPYKTWGTATPPPSYSDKKSNSER